MVDMNPYWTYAGILAAYLPGLYAIARYRLYHRFPVLTLAFLGWFVLNALGSLAVFLIPNKVFFLRNSAPLLNPDYVALLIAQALLSYVCFAPYIMFRAPKTGYRFIPQRGDREMQLIMAAVIIAIVVGYRIMVGPYLLFQLMGSQIDATGIGELRNAALFGRGDAWIYIAGFFFLPILFAIHTVMLVILTRKCTVLDALLVVLCVIAPCTLMGFKTGLTEPLLAGILTYIFVRPMAARRRRKVAAGQMAMQWLQRLAGITIFLIPTIFLYLQAFGRKASAGLVLGQLLVRTLCISSLQIAIIPAYVASYGYQNGSSWFPLNLYMNNISGANLDVQLAHFMYGKAGAAPTPALTECYANFGWDGFIVFGAIIMVSVILIQEVFLTIDLGVFGTSLMLLYGYFAAKLATQSLIAIIVQPYFLFIFGGLAAVRYFFFAGPGRPLPVPDAPLRSGTV